MEITSYFYRILTIASSKVYKVLKGAACCIRIYINAEVLLASDAHFMLCLHSFEAGSRLRPALCQGRPFVHGNAGEAHLPRISAHSPIPMRNHPHSVLQHSVAR